MPQKTYNTGDVLAVGAWPLGLFAHFGIVFHKDGVAYVAHNVPSGIEVLTLDEFLSDRNILRVIPTDGRLNDQWIINKIQEINGQDIQYSFLKYNCEHFIRDVCACDIGLDQRVEFGVLFLMIAIIAIILLFILNRLK